MKLKSYLNEFVLVFFLTLLATPLAFAQDKAAVDPPELIAKREEHLRAMQRVTTPELQAYAAKLNGLKQQFAREGKLEAGLAVENELREVTRETAGC